MDHPSFQKLEQANLERQQGFLHSAVMAALETNRLHLSQTLIKLLHSHAIAGLYADAGQYRRSGVRIENHIAPDHYRIQSLMDDFVDDANRNWQNIEPVTFAAYVFWRLTWIHPFINGNGRTARAISYYALCVQKKEWLPGRVLLPQLLVQHQAECHEAIHIANTHKGFGQVELKPLQELFARLLAEQSASA